MEKLSKYFVQPCGTTARLWRLSQSICTKTYHLRHIYLIVSYKMWWQCEKLQCSRTPIYTLFTGQKLVLSCTGRTSTFDPAGAPDPAKSGTGRFVGTLNARNMPKEVRIEEWAGGTAREILPCLAWTFNSWNPGIGKVGKWPSCRCHIQLLVQTGPVWMITIAPCWRPGMP